MSPQLSPATISDAIQEAAHPLGQIETEDMSAILARIGDARIVLLGEATHGTSEFYRMRARITEALIEEKGFNVVALEADWPDAARIDDYVRDRPPGTQEWNAFARFPTWMWRNHEFERFVTDLRERNTGRPEHQQVGVYGLDLYSLGTSIDAVLRFLDERDPDAAALARERYDCLSPFEHNPAGYGKAAATGAYPECEDDVVAMLSDLLEERLSDLRDAPDGHRMMDAVQNARVVRNAERYYRSMYRGDLESWNLRDRHMADTLEHVLVHRGIESKAVVWAHNSHIGDARATEMAVRGEHNLGQLVRQADGENTYSIGFGTNQGTVAAANHWEGDMRVMDLVPARADSHERLMHETDEDAFFLALDDPRVAALDETRLERAIGVIYRPDSERRSHYFRARLASQFDGYIWFDRTEAVAPLGTVQRRGLPETYPFGV